MKDDSFDCTLIAHLRIFLLFYRLLYCLILPENRLFFGIWKVVEIEDNGIGIQAEDLPRVFEKGFTGYNGRADKKSTGIGLYLCKKIMDKMGHKIWIDSEVGKGTRVYLELTRKEWNPE